MIELAEIWTAAHPARVGPRELSELGTTMIFKASLAV
jgi:hypothetical protein